MHKLRESQDWQSSVFEASIIFVVVVILSV